MEIGKVIEGTQIEAIKVKIRRVEISQETLEQLMVRRIMGRITGEEFDKQAAEVLPKLRVF